MAEFPALPLFTDAYLADTRHLTTEQHGAYLLLLMTAWRMPDCALPDDDNFLARICGMSKRTWIANKSTLISFWRKDENGRFFQRRLADERAFVEKKRNKNSFAGKASALKRLNRGSTYVQPEGNVNSTPTPTPTPTPNKKERKEDHPPTPTKEIFTPPAWMQNGVMEAWQGWLEVRNKLRAPNTPKALALAVRELEKLKALGHDPLAVIEQSTARGWRGLFAIKAEFRGGGYANQEPEPIETRIARMKSKGLLT